MARGYDQTEILRRLVKILGESESGMSGSELASRMGMSRITLSKYLGYFEMRGIVQGWRAGNVNIWSITRATTGYEFPQDYFKVAPRYQEMITAGDGTGARTVIQNCIQSGAKPFTLISEVVLPAIQSANNMHQEGKIGDTELRMYWDIIVKSLQGMTLNHAPLRTKNCIIMTAQPSHVIYSQAVSAALSAKGWRICDLGDISGIVDVFFDIELQKIMNRIWRGTPGIMVVTVFGGGSEELKFLSDSVRQAESKFGGMIRLALCSQTDGNRFGADMASPNPDDIMQWCETVHQNI